MTACCTGVPRASTGSPKTSVRTAYCVSIALANTAAPTSANAAWVCGSGSDPSRSRTPMIRCDEYLNPRNTRSTSAAPRTNSRLCPSSRPAPGKRSNNSESTNSSIIPGFSIRMRTRYDAAAHNRTSNRSVARLPSTNSHNPALPPRESVTAARFARVRSGRGVRAISDNTAAATLENRYLHRCDDRNRTGSVDNADRFRRAASTSVKPWRARTSAARSGSKSGSRTNAASSLPPRAEVATESARSINSPLRINTRARLSSSRDGCPRPSSPVSPNRAAIRVASPRSPWPERRDAVTQASCSSRHSRT